METEDEDPDLKTGTTRAILQNLGNWPSLKDLFINSLRIGEMRFDINFNILTEYEDICADLFSNELIIRATSSVQIGEKKKLSICVLLRKSAYVGLSDPGAGIESSIL